MNNEAPSTPQNRKRKSGVLGLFSAPRSVLRSAPRSAMITPSASFDDGNDEDERKCIKSSEICRQLEISMPSFDGTEVTSEITPLSSTTSGSETEAETPEARAASTAPKQRRFFTYSSALEDAKPNTRKVYTLVNKLTGRIGGNGCGGAIYGELTIGSMQKMVEMMREHTDFGPKSRFIDVGSGLGKPNLHVAQDPGVEFSYGIEMERVRWVLGMSNLNAVLQEAQSQELDKSLSVDERIRHRCMFAHGDITEAQYFDPFTHVYMFDIGFPPKLFKELGRMFNRSQSEYLICYHGPHLMIDRYGFNVELIIQTPTSMHGSSEIHSGYIYRRTGGKKRPGKGLRKVNGVPCDPLFEKAWRATMKDVQSLSEDVKGVVNESLNSERPKRKRRTVSHNPYESAVRHL